MTFYIKQNDTSPTIEYALLANGSTVDLSGATVRFHMARGTRIVIDSLADIIDPIGGVVAYQWQPSDTSVVGTFNAEFEVTYADGSIETFPNTGYETVEITANLA